jgi:hypothetical protein
MIDSISTKAVVDATTNILKNSDSTSDSMSEINAMRNDHDPRLKEASDLSIETKLINSQTNLNKAKVSKAFWAVLASPLSAFGYAGRKIGEVLNNYSEEQQRDLRNKINRVVDSDIEITPTTLPILASATEALLYAEQEPNLKEMFEDLIVNTIDKTKSTHPSFVEILKQLLGKEAEILKVVLQATSEIIYLPLVDIKLIDKEKGTYIKVYRNLINLYDSETNAYYVNDELPSFIDNWVRLGLVVISTNNESLSDKSDYEKFNDHPVFKKLKSNYLQSNPEKSLKLAEGFLEITDFGRSFAKAISVI